jgi:PST family polysaccharide transporter
VQAFLAAQAPPAAQASLAAQAARGVAWNVFASLASRTATFAASVVVARWLAPAEYAVGGLAAAAAGFFAVWAGQGFARALVRLPEVSSLACDTAFWVTAALGAAVAVAAALAGPALAAFYAQPELAAAVAVLAAGLVAGALGAVPIALLGRAMRFRELGMLRAACGCAAALCAVVAVVLGAGYLALVLPPASSAVLEALAAFRLTRYRPRFRFSRAAFRQLRAFGFAELGSEVLLYFNQNSDYLVLRRVWSPAAFGCYYFGFERAQQPFGMVIDQLRGVLLPTFSRIQGDPERLRAAYLRSTVLFATVSFPLHVALVGLADPALVWIFGEEWRPAIPVFQVFALFGFVRALAAVAPSMFLALDDAEANLRFNALRLAVILPALVVLAWASAGIVATACAFLALWTLMIPLYLGALYRRLGLRWGDVGRAIAPMLAAAAAMAAALGGARSVAAASAWPLWLDVVVASVAAAGVYGAVARRELLRTFRDLRAQWRAPRER